MWLFTGLLSNGLLSESKGASLGMMRYIKQLARRGIVYWTRIGLIIFAGVYAGGWLTERDYWIDQRYKVYQFLQNRLPRKPHPQRTVLVLIGDEEYWKGELAGRVPIKRGYLARLVHEIDSANAAVIALDFDLRSPSPEGNPVESPAYQGETLMLLEEVKRASHRRKIVLPKTIGLDDRQRYVLESDIHGGYDFQGGDVSFGYIALPPDTRQVPLLSLPVQNGPPIASFSQAILKADNEAILSEHHEEPTLPYSGYMTSEAFPAVTADQVLKRDPEALRKLAFKVVVVGGSWHDRAFNTGRLVDIYETPVGSIPGVLIHANYFEALLDSRIYRPWKGWLLTLLEVLQSLAIAIPFALDTRFLYKVLAVAGISVLLVVFSVLSLMVLGLFFDFFIPEVLVITHGVVEQIREWKERAAASGGRKQTT